MSINVVEKCSAEKVCSVPYNNFNKCIVVIFDKQHSENAAKLLIQQMSTSTIIDVAK